MTTKTLGQVLYEVYEGHGLPYCQLSDKDRERYEAEAQAVAAVVREQAVMACEAQRLPVCTEFDLAADNAIDACVAAVSGMTI